MSAALTLEVARAWRPTALADAASGVERARTEVEAHVQAAKATMARLAETWQGDAARAAAERMARDAGSGLALADALASARSVLESGASQIGSARDAVLGTVELARADGFSVASDGRVTAPTLPPVLTSPGDPTGAGTEREARQRALNRQAADHAESISAALSLLADTDRDVARRLEAVQVPQTLESAVEAYLQRVVASRDHIASLGAVGAGGVALAQVIKKLLGLGTRSASYAKLLKLAFAPVKDAEAIATALDEFKYGKAPKEWVGKLLGNADRARAFGKVFLPVTVATGALDAFTGGGYEGARGWATRGFGAAGAVGAGALMFMTLNPVGLAVAGGAVLAYGAWSLGNLVWDNREEIGQFLTSAGGRVADAWNATTEAVSEAKDWAGNRLADAGRAVRETGEAVRDMGKGALDVLSFGLL
ncbi:WXG100 family type VII secretion target [Cellulomonas sp. 179-A 9B4 NHS]|uniref:hypothetical protein n=1 Tax=Cellulomonas sp. 179-A 9B4 NHS TaxID=3142379 RepID=UPI0039A15D6F